MLQCVAEKDTTAAAGGTWGGVIAGPGGFRTFDLSWFIPLPNGLRSD